MRRILCGHGHQTKQFIILMNEAQYNIVVKRVSFSNVGICDKKKSCDVDSAN